MASRCDGVSRLGDSGPSHVLPAPQRPAEFKGLLIKNSPIVYNGKSKTVTRRSLAILHLPPLVALTVDGEPKSKPKAMPTMDCCKDGLMAAVKAAKPGDTILIPGGTYTEQIFIDKSIALAPIPGQSVTVRWVSDRPYESTFVVQTHEKVSIRGITIQHSSPSIANNYAMYLGPQCSPWTRVEDCTITSSTGSGIGIEGGTPMLLRCTIRDCAQNGVCIYGNSTMEGSEEMYLSRSESPVVKGCFIERNNRHGVLIRDGAVPEIAANTIMNNAGYGLVLQNCGGSYKSNVVEKNSKGAVAYWMTDIGDGKADNIGELFARSNSMLGGTVMETRVTS